MSNDSAPSFIPGRRWSIGLSVVVSCLALLAIVIMFNYLAARHFSRFQWAQETRHQLSPMTVRLLEALTNKIDVVVMYDRRDDLYRSVSGLLNEYRLASPNLQVEWIDYVVSPARAELVSSQYKLGHAPDRNRIIFHHNGTKRVVDERELSEFDTSGILEGKQIKRIAFRGEQLFTSAIYSILDAKEPKAYFLKGHGEHDYNSTDSMGYSKFARILQDSRIGVGEVSLLVNDIPADCNLLIIAAPIRPLDRGELEKIERYLIQGGRLLTMFNIQSLGERTGMESLLAKWGVEVGQDTVQDLAQAQSGQPVVVTSEFGSHPIVTPLVRPRLRVGMIAPRSISKSHAGPQSADPPRVTELIFTSGEGEARPIRGAVRTGAIPMMVAVEKGTIQGVSVDRGTTRIVAMGESLFLSNNFIDGEANRDLALMAVNWLLNRDLLIEEIGPRPIREYQITLTQAQMKGLQWMLLGGLPGAVFFTGLIVWVRRRS